MRKTVIALVVLLFGAGAAHAQGVPANPYVGVWVGQGILQGDTKSGAFEVFAGQAGMLISMTTALGDLASAAQSSLPVTTKLYACTVAGGVLTVYVDSITRDFGAIDSAGRLYLTTDHGNWSMVKNYRMPKWAQ